MNLTLYFAAAIGLGCLAAFGLVFRRLYRGTHTDPVDPGWLATFSPVRYRPMERLLAEGDFTFLASQPGFSATMKRRFRAERRKIFRSYLRKLAIDFERLHRAARMLVLCAPEDRSDYAAALVRERFRFQRTMLSVHCRLALNWLNGAAVDTSGLVSALEAMNAQVRLLAAAPATA